jgi:hypothetical protein
MQLNNDPNCNSHNGGNWTADDCNYAPNKTAYANITHSNDWNNGTPGVHTNATYALS